MRTIVAALDNSLAAGPVLATALALGPVLDAEVGALHVTVDGERVARNEAVAVGVPFHTTSGGVVERLSEAALKDEVAAVVIGARGTPAGHRPLGGTALAVATSLAKPVFIVPPDARRPGVIRRVLVPLEGDRAESFTPRSIVELAEGTELDVIVVHVLEEESLPSFTDQPQHEQTAWATEFLRRYCPWGIGSVQLLVRIGRTEDIVPEVAVESGVDVIAIAWAQELADEHAPVVRAALARSRATVMLVPVQARAVVQAPSTSSVLLHTAG